MDFKVKLQKFGRTLSGMVMPNIGALIAWGFITALFIPTGWLPNENLAAMVGPMLTYLIPLLIAYTGGKTIGGVKGGVVGATATMGVIVGTDIPMLMGAMVTGPIGGWCIKKFDDAIDGKVKAGFEMLVNNFSTGIIGMLLAIVGYYAIGPVIEGFTNFLSGGVEILVNANLLPLTSLFVEPAKILFLNNAINHGIFGPLGVAQAAEIGKSIFFMIETNPGPGLGVLLAFWIYGKGMVKNSAPGAIIIHFFGGIHEIYFPYILMKPVLLLAVMAGGASGVFVFNIMSAGLVATPSPGSIFALLAMTPKGDFLAVILGVIVATAVSFVIASFFLRKADLGDDELEKAKEQMIENKGKGSSVVKTKGEVKSIVVACDAGMGSSAMGATLLKNKVKDAGLDIDVRNYAIENIPESADIVITQESLTPMAKKKRPNATHLSIGNFMDAELYDNLVAELCSKADSESQETKEAVDEEEKQEAKELLKKENIILGVASENKYKAIERAGNLLKEAGYVEAEYVSAMAKREEVTTTYIGNNLAIPHGVGGSEHLIKESGISIVQYPDGVDFGDGNTAYVVIGIAGKDNEHLTILSQIAKIFSDMDKVEQLSKETDKDKIYNIITEVVGE